MADVKWIKITTDIFDNRKIRQIECLPDGDSIIVVWMKLLILAGSINDDGFIYFTKDIPYTEQMLSAQFCRPIAKIQFAIKTFQEFGMIEVVNGMLHISNWEKYQNVDGMNKIREQTRKRVAKHREIQKCLIPDSHPNNDVTLHVTQCNATDIDIDKEVDIDKEKDINNSCAIPTESHDTLEDFYESIWKLYPIKKGKGQVSKSKKQVLIRIGFDELERCVNRFIEDMKQNNTDKKYWMHGSTFFNSGYVDYLDKNYEKDIPKKAEVQKEPEEEILTEEQILELIEKCGAE